MTEILTIQELAERFKVSEKTVRRAIKAGRLRAAKLGGDGGSGGVWRIALEDARAWFENCATTHAPPSVAPAPQRRRRTGVTPPSCGKLADAQGNRRGRIRMSVHRVPGSKGGGWEVRWRQHGRQRSKRFHDKDLADIFAADLRKRRRLGTLDDLDAGTELLCDWGRVWREKRAKVRLAASTLRRYEQVWDLWVLPYLGEYELREIDVGVADDYVADLHDAGCGLETQRKALYLLQAVLGYAVRRRRISYNPMLSFDKPRGRRRAVKPLRLTAIETMIASLPPRDSVLTELMAYQGLRPGEALALADTSIRDRTLLVESNISLGEEKDTKTHRIRTVNFLRPVPQDLAAYRLGTRRDRAPGCPLLFPRPDGKPWRDTDYRNWRRRVFRPAAVVAGLATSTVKRLPDGSKRRRYDGPRPYDLRHTFVSLLIQEGRSIAYVAEQAGHTVEECARTYTHLFDEYRDARPVPAENLIQSARAHVEQGRAAL